MLNGNWTLVFEDNFEQLNKSVWSIRNTTYREGMTQSKGDWRAVSISHKTLRLKLLADPDNPGKWLTGHIGTENTFEFTHGYVEARMRFHPYHGIHSALWLQGTEPYAPGQAEIDAAEYFGSKNPERRNGTDVYHNVYYPSATGSMLRAWDTTNDIEFFKDSTRWYNSYNVFGINWTPNGQTFYINDKEVFQTTAGATSSPKYIVLSTIAKDYEVPNIEPTFLNTYKLSVDWVRAWQLKL